MGLEASESCCYLSILSPYIDGTTPYNYLNFYLKYQKINPRQAG